jgi:hypothetical protein
MKFIFRPRHLCICTTYGKYLSILNYNLSVIDDQSLIQQVQKTHRNIINIDAPFHYEGMFGSIYKAIVRSLTLNRCILKCVPS